MRFYFFGKLFEFLENMFSFVVIVPLNHPLCKHDHEICKNQMKTITILSLNSSEKSVVI